jgi:methionine-rich copper-binding protein CopC
MNGVRHGLVLATIAAIATLAVPREATSTMHLRLTGSQPARDTVLGAAPTQICLWYSQKPMLRLSSVTLTGPRGAVALGRLTLEARDSAPIVARIEGAVPPGNYVIAWRTASSDGHPIRGTIPFTVR